MGQAKQRGTFDERRDAAMKRGASLMQQIRAAKAKWETERREKLAALSPADREAVEKMVAQNRVNARRGKSKFGAMLAAALSIGARKAA